MRLGMMAFVPALLCLLLALSMQPGAVLGWTPASTSGDWILADQGHFIRNGTGISGSASWDYSANFTGYWFMLHNVTWQNYRQWWQPYTAQTFYIVVNITDSSGSVLAVTRLKGETNFFGALNTFHVLVGAFNTTSWDDINLRPPAFPFNFGTILWNPSDFQLFVIPEGNQTKLVWIWNSDGQNIGYTAIIDRAVSGPVNATLTYRHDGDGYAEGYVADSFALPAVPSYQEGTANLLTTIQQSLGVLAPAVMVLLALIQLFFEAVRLTLPLLGAIVFLWMMDTIFTAVSTGEVRLIGDMFLRIYDFVRAVWQTIAALIQTIWDLITFWS